ncbi:hypothetical protein BC830DRAFT_1120231 [Chytriomyces sp. MP71]|nr:hypothetical protein BC830DRAFT_1120231 [Chytriomyces sp. MP71]
MVSPPFSITAFLLASTITTMAVPIAPRWWTVQDIEIVEEVPVYVVETVSVASRPIQVPNQVCCIPIFKNVEGGNRLEGKNEVGRLEGVVEGRKKVGEAVRAGEGRKEVGMLEGVKEGKRKGGEAAQTGEGGKEGGEIARGGEGMREGEKAEGERRVDGAVKKGSKVPKEDKGAKKRSRMARKCQRERGKGSEILKVKVESGERNEGDIKEGMKVEGSKAEGGEGRKEGEMRGGIKAEGGINQSPGIATGSSVRPLTPPLSSAYVQTPLITFLSLAFLV